MMDVIAHAGSADSAHLLADALAGIGVGVAAVALYLLVLRYYVGSSGSR